MTSTSFDYATFVTRQNRKMVRFEAKCRDLREPAPDAMVANHGGGAIAQCTVQTENQQIPAKRSRTHEPALGSERS